MVLALLKPRNGKLSMMTHRLSSEKAEDQFIAIVAGVEFCSVMSAVSSSPLSTMLSRDNVNLC